MLVESIQSRHTSAGVRGLSLDSDRWDQPPVVFSNLVELTKYYRFIYKLFQLLADAVL